MNRWAPDLGDYVWWSKRDEPWRGDIPAQVVKEALATDHDWYVRSLTGPQGPDHWTPVYTEDLEPMNAMEVIALAVKWPDAVI